MSSYFDFQIPENPECFLKLMDFGVFSFIINDTDFAKALFTIFKEAKF